MKKSILVLSGLLFCSAFAFSNTEPKSSIDTSFLMESEKTSYTEWTGGYSPSEINTANQIRDIGRRLANGINYQESVQDEEVPYNKGNPAYKYSAARIYGGDKRGADVILIGATATVDTIKCLKMILQGYVENAYGCSAEDSEALAQAICNWNTALYNNPEMLDSFSPDIKTVFEGYARNIGLSNSYKDWKKSVLIIPHIFTKVQISDYVEEQNDFDSAYATEPEAAAEAEIETSSDKVVNEYKYESNKNSNKPAAVSNQKKKGGKNNLILISAICGGAVLIAAIFIIIALRKKE